MTTYNSLVTQMLYTWTKVGKKVHIREEPHTGAKFWFFKNEPKIQNPKNGSNSGNGSKSKNGF